MLNKYIYCNFIYVPLLRFAIQASPDQTDLVVQSEYQTIQTEIDSDHINLSQARGVS